jgi:C_GCAxxG_C_C family probable redox protein
MDRRRFLRATVACPAAAAAGGWTVGALAKESPAAVATIDADALAAAAHKHFIPGKKTCGEAILAAGCEALGISSDLVPDIALGLAGGCGLQGKTCGCVTGSAMVVGLAVGRQETDYGKKKKRTFKAVGGLVGRFEEQFGSTECRTISGLDLTKAADRKKLADHVKAQRCAKVVIAAARMLAETLATA